MHRNLFVAASLLIAASALSACDQSNSAKPAASSSASAAPSASAANTDIPPPPDVAAPPASAEKTKTGLASKILTPGTGTDHPAPQDSVQVHYTGWLTTGKMFDSSMKRGQPARFGLKGVIPGWTEGLQLMVKGEKRRFWIPEELAYKGRPGAPAGMLVFDVELLDITPGPKPIPAPADVAAAPADGIKTKSGLVSKILEKGKGKKHPVASSNVKVNYTGWTTDGEMFDSSLTRGQPASFELGNVVPGWTEGVQLMVEGEKRRFWIPEELAYKGRPGSPKGMLVFEIELLEIAEAPQTPADVKAPPADAKKTSTGLASKVLKAGTGKSRPAATSTVEVQYSGWTTDGKMFDSSVTRGQPARFPLNGVIAGWTEGVQLMVEGEKRRFWIPEALAYKGRPGSPQGMLVFDVELLKIVSP